MEKPVINYRFGDRYWVTDFVAPDNPDVKEIVERMPGDNFVDAVAEYVRDNYQYPLSRNLPSCDGQLWRYSQGFCKKGFKRRCYYVWAFVPETIQSKLGYCAETANLCTSLLRAKVVAWTAIGEVRKLSDDLLGYHAWTVVNYRDSQYIDETTIHSKANVLVLASDAYDKNSQFCQRGGIYYVEHARYSEAEYIGVTDLGRSGVILNLLGKPLKMLNLYGLETLLTLNPKKVYKAWRREEVVKQQVISSAYGG